MFSYQTILSSVLPVFLVIGLGLALRWTSFISRDVDRSLFRLTLNVLIPCLILDSMLGNRALQDTGTPLVASFLGSVTVLLGFLVCWWMAPLAGLAPGPEQRTFAVSAGIYNWAYLALPVTLALFGRETVGVLFAFNLGVETMLWTVGIILLTGGSAADGWKRIFNAPVLAILSSLLLNALHAREWLPGFLLSAVHMVGACAIPMGLMIVGASFYDQTGTAEFKKSGRVGVVACLCRLLILPLLFLALAKYVPMSMEIRRVLVVQAAMPSAVFPIILAQHYGGHTPTALRVVLITSIASLVTIPLWIRLGMAWVG